MKPKGPKFDIVQVEFLDHSSCSDGVGGVLPIVVFGILLGEDAVQIHVGSWLSPTDASDLANYDTYSILKSAITKMKKLGKYS